MQLLAIATIIVSVMIPNITTYATYPTVSIDGTVTESGCKVIGGIKITETIDVQHTQLLDLCKYGDRYFRLIDSTRLGGFTVVGSWTDPETGKSNSSIIPKFVRLSS